MVCTPSENNLQIILEKYLSKDPARKIFFTILSPEETMKFIPGKYVAAFELTNEDLMYRREIHDKIRVKPQVVWDKPGNNFGHGKPSEDSMNHFHGDDYDVMHHKPHHHDPLGCIPQWNPNIPAIVTGPRGKDGRSAYEVAVKNGFEGTVDQ